MQSLQVELIFRLDRHETHVLALHRLGNRFRIAVVVLVRLDERPHKLRRNQSHLVPLFAQRSPQKVRPHTGFHPHQAGRQIRRVGQQLLSRKLLPNYHLRMGTQSD